MDGGRFLPFSCLLLFTQKNHTVDVFDKTDTNMHLKYESIKTFIYLWRFGQLLRVGTENRFSDVRTMMIQPTASFQLFGTIDNANDCSHHRHTNNKILIARNEDI